MPSAFAKAFAKKAKTFDQAKGYKHKAGKSFGKADVPDGTYTAVVTLETSVPTKGSMEGVPIVRATASITAGQYLGQEPSQSFFCQGKPCDDPDKPTDEQKLLGLLEFLLPDVQIDEADQVEQAIELVNQRGPLCLVAVRNTVGTNKKEYQNVYFNKVLKGSTFEDESNAGSDPPEQDTASGAETTQSSDDSPLGGDPDTPDYVPVKGDMVTVVDKDGEWEIKQVSQSRLTVNIEDQDGQRINGVPWTDLTLL